MKKSFLNRVICLILTMTLLLGLLPLTSSAASDTEWTYGTTKTVSGGYKVGGETYSLIQGVYLYPSVVPGPNGFEVDQAATFFYSDGFFAEDAYTYNSHLATTSLNMAMTAFYSNQGLTGPNGEYGLKSEHIGQFLIDIGCDRRQIYMNGYNTIRPQTDSIGVTIGQKPLATANGTPTGRILVPIAIRGANYEKEWASNVTLGNGSANSGEALGFATAANVVFSELQGYLKNYGLEQAVAQGKVDFWIAGYSRAGATTNLTSRRIVDAYAQTESSGNRVFAYCIEAPQGGWDAAETSGNNYNCIHSVINKSDLVPRVAPSAMSFRRYGLDHFIPGTAPGTPGKRSDNKEYAVGSGEYLALKPLMLTHLKAVNSYINFSDDFKVYGLNTAQLKSALVSTATPLTFMLHAIGMGLSMKEDKKNLIIRKGTNISMDAFLDEFFSNLCSWTSMTRKAYSDGHMAVKSSVQTAARDYMAIVFDSTPKELDDFTDSLIGLWKNDKIGVLDLLGIFMNAFGEWHKPDFTKKDYYIAKFVNWMKESGAYDKLNLSKAEKDQLMTKDLPVLADFLMTYLSADYRNNLHNTDGMTQLLTFLANAENIMSNHYPEVNLAWLRAQDSLYEKETSAVSVTIPEQYSDATVALNGTDWHPASVNAHDISEKALRDPRGGLTVTAPKGMLYGTRFYYRFSNMPEGSERELTFGKGVNTVRIPSLNGTGKYELLVIRKRGQQTASHIYYLNVVEDSVQLHITNYQNGNRKEIHEQTSDNVVRLTTEVPDGQVFDYWSVEELHGDGSLRYWSDKKWKSYEIYERNAEINVGSAEWLHGDQLYATAHFRQAPEISCQITVMDSEGGFSTKTVLNHGTELNLQTAVPERFVFQYWEIEEYNRLTRASRSYRLAGNPASIDLENRIWREGGTLETRAVLTEQSLLQDSEAAAALQEETGSQLLAAEPSPYIAGVDVSVDLPEAGKPFPEKVNSCTVRMEDGAVYSVSPDAVVLDWLLDKKVQYSQAVANESYTARVRLADSGLRGTYLLQDATILFNSTVRGVSDYAFDLVDESGSSLASGYHFFAELKAGALVADMICDSDPIYLDHGMNATEGLPSRLTAFFSDGTQGTVPVTWDLNNAVWYALNAGDDDWTRLDELDLNTPSPLWATVSGTAAGQKVFAEVFISGLPDADPPLASFVDGAYSSPINVTLYSTTIEDPFILYTLDGSDPRHSSTAKRYQDPILLGDDKTVQEVDLIAYIVSPDGYSQVDDSNYSIWHYSFGEGAHGIVTVTPVNHKPGDTVTVSVEPEQGYTRDELFILDSEGNPLKVSRWANDTLTFKVPEGGFYVNATFREKVFSDVRETSWDHEPIYYVYDRGFFVGVEDDLFAPKTVMNRAMFAQVLYHLSGKPDSTAANPFTDVPDGKWYTKAVCWAADNGYVAGYGNGRYGPLDPVTREQMASILWAFAGKPAAGVVDLSRFTDAEEISGWARGAVEWAVSAGIVNGKGNGILDPRGKATRAEVAQIIMKYDSLTP